MKNLTIETITAACRGTLHGSADPAGREAAMWSSTAARPAPATSS